MLNEPDVGEGEVLTGAELYHYLMEENASRLQRAEAKISEYTTLKATLETITERCRRPVLAPVANGLAYFEAELDATNNILVLLGDGWFAERSATQAAAIAQRRIDFLRREHQVLAEEKRSLAARQELFLSEVPDAEAAMLSVATARKPDAEREARSGSANAAGGVGSLAEGNRSTARPSGASQPPFPSAAAVSPAGPLDSTELDALAQAVDPELTLFDDEDALTQEELMALELEIGDDRIDDDEFVERLMVEKMIAKKEARVRAEIARRQQMPPPQSRAPLEQQEPLTSAAEAGARATLSEQPPVPAPQAPVSLPEQLFRTPADIAAGFALAGCPASSPLTVEYPNPRPAVSGGLVESQEPSRSLPAAPAASDGSRPAPQKRVTFADAVDVRPAEPAPPVRVATSSADPAAPPSERVTYAMGDVVERPAGSGGVPPRNPVLLGGPLGAGGPAKRKSRFLMEMEGDEDAV